MTLALPTHVATAQAGVIHRRQLLAAGLRSRSITSRVARGELVEVGPGVYLVAGTEATWKQRLWAGLLSTRPGAVVSHRSGGRLHAIGRFTEDHVDILEVENTHHRVSRSSAHRTSWLPPHHRTVIDGIPVTSAARTVFDLAGLSSTKRWIRGWPSITEAAATRALDDALASGKVDRESVTEVLETMATQGRPGTVLTRRLLDERGEGFIATESVLEDLLHSVLVDHGLPIPERQRNLGSSAAPIGRVDFVYRTERIVIEADSRKHHSALSDAEADRWRDLELTAAGWLVVRVTWRQLKDEPTRFVSGLRTLLERRGRELTNR